MSNVVTFPTGMLAAGHIPGLCVRHGEPAVVRWSLHRGRVQNWPFCRQCVRARRVALPLAIGCFALPFVVLIVGAILLADDPIAEATFTDVMPVFVLAGILTGWVLVFRNTPSGLARAKLTDSGMFLVIQGAHPAFAAHAAQIIGAAEQARAYQPQPPDFPVAGGDVFL